MDVSPNSQSGGGAGIEQLLLMLWNNIHPEDSPNAGTLTNAVPVLGLGLNSHWKPDYWFRIGSFRYYSKQKYPTFLFQLGAGLELNKYKLICLQFFKHSSFLVCYAGEKDTKCFLHICSHKNSILEEHSNMTFISMDLWPHSKVSL